MKIVYCLNSISEIGGIARVTVAKANALAEIPSNEVFICVSDHKDNELSKQLSPKVKLIDLNIDYYKDDWKSKWYVLKGIIIKRFKHKKALKIKLEEIKPDIVVAAGQCEKYFIPAVKGAAKAVRELHYPGNYRNLNADGFLNKIKATIENLYDFGYKINRYDKIVVLTEEDRISHWSENNKVAVIPNPTTFSSVKTSPLTNKKIVTVGRLTPEKNHSSLIKAFSRVVKHHPDWTLEIYGEGVLKNVLQKEIEALGLGDNVKLMGNTMELSNVYNGSSAFVLTSRFEGFGLVLVEAMEHGLPVVSYDCPCGPKDIISNGHDGFLVPSGNEEILAEKICYLIEHPRERIKMGMAAKEKAANFALDKIINQWMSLFKAIC